jgi:hypothetical protein
MITITTHNTSNPVKMENFFANDPAVTVRGKARLGFSYHPIFT